SDRGCARAGGGRRRLRRRDERTGRRRDRRRRRIARSRREHVLGEALAAGVPYVALVASARRGEAVRESLDVPDELRAQLHTPAGLNVGARTPEEIAVSIL